MTSMTGYACSEETSSDVSVFVEIRSVNSRFLDITFNGNQALGKLEYEFREKIAKYISRGKIDVFIRINSLESSGTVNADTNLALSYLEAIKNVSKATGLQDDFPLRFLVNEPGVLTIENGFDIEKYKDLLDKKFNDCLQLFIEDKNREGKNMQRDLIKKFDKLCECAQIFKNWQGKMEEAFKSQLIAKFTDLLGDETVKECENRILTETATMLVRYTINEEIVRLFSHLDAMKIEINENQTPGKRLDFLCQEINREINTIASKNQFAELGKTIIDAKDAIENIREQSKNIE